MSFLTARLLLPSLLLGLVNAAFPASQNLIKRGRYLVVQVGKCGDCHTPRMPTGASDEHRLLKGSPIGFKPLAPVPGWASAAPDLTSTGSLWKSWGEDALKQFFVTGRGPNGRMAAPPMPAYTLNNEDALAIVTYLKSLK